MPVQTTNIASITFPVSDDTVIIANGVIVSGTVGSNRPNSTLINYGNIFGGVNYAGSGTGDIINRDGATISGANGIEIFSQANIVNDGAIFGASAYGVAFTTLANSSALNNRGDIYGETAGVALTTASAVTMSIVNSGEIRGDTHGILLSGANAAPVVVNSGVVIGRVNSIYATSSDRLNLTNSGTLSGNVTADSAFAPDKVTNTGRIVGNVSLGTGADLYQGAGSVTGTVFGEGGADVLSGGKLADRLSGGLDGDTLNGGLGIDTLNGGLGNDFFVFSAPVVAANRDIIQDYGNASGNNDTIRLENAFFTKIGAPGLLKSTAFKLSTQVKDADDRIIYNKAQGILSYDSDGSGAAAPIVFAQFSSTIKPTLTAADFVVI